MNPFFLIIGGVIVLILLIVGVVVTVTSEHSLVEERLGRYLEDEKPQEGDNAEGGRNIATEWLNRRVASSSLGDRVSRELARADLKFKVAEYFALVFMSSVAVAFLAYLIQPLLASALIGAAVGFFI